MARASAWPSSSVRTPQREFGMPISISSRAGGAPGAFAETFRDRSRALETVDQHVVRTIRRLRPHAGEAGDFSFADQLIREDRDCDTPMS